jgi:CBS domain-containing protein
MNERNQPEPSLEDFKNALKELDTFIDVNPEDLMQINRIAQKHAQLRQVEHLMVRDIMTSGVVTVGPDTSLREAAGILLERRISGLPVTDENGKLVGIVTEADFLCAMGIPCHHPAHSLWQTLESMFRYHRKPVNTGTGAKVADIMAQQVVTLADDKTLYDAIDTMKRHHIKRIVVTDEQQCVQGIITRSNLIHVLLQQIL